MTIHPAPAGFLDNCPCCELGSCQGWDVPTHVKLTAIGGSWPCPEAGVPDYGAGCCEELLALWNPSVGWGVPLVQWIPYCKYTRSWFLPGWEECYASDGPCVMSWTWSLSLTIHETPFPGRIQFGGVIGQDGRCGGYPSSIRFDFEKVVDFNAVDPFQDQVIDAFDGTVLDYVSGPTPYTGGTGQLRVNYSGFP